MGALASNAAERQASPPAAGWKGTRCSTKGTLWGMMFLFGPEFCLNMHLNGSHLCLHLLFHGGLKDGIVLGLIIALHIIVEVKLVWRAKAFAMKFQLEVLQRIPVLNLVLLAIKETDVTLMPDGM